MSNKQNEIFYETQHEKSLEDFGEHDHTEEGECLVFYWKGAETKKWENEESQQELQKRVEANHENQKKIWKQEMITANQKPF